MSTYKKTIFLTNKENSNKGMAILTLQKQNKGIFCTLKSYNVTRAKSLVLGLKCDNTIIKQNVNLENNIYNFLLNQEINLEKNLGCVLLDTSNNNIVPIIWGSEKADNFKSQIVNNLKNSIQKLQNNTHSLSYKPTINKKDETPLTEEINSNALHNQINLNSYMEDNNLKESMPTQNISDNSEIAQVAGLSSLFESDENDINNAIDNNLKEEQMHTSHKFYDMISDQLDELFDRYPREENLEKLVENSKWVKVKYEDQDKYYVVGLIYLNNDIKYICYGVPGDYYSDPPSHLKNYSQWLPYDPISPYTKGYWVMYQDGDTGENILIN